MAFQRERTLRKAERFRRQGRLSAAIAAFSEVIEHDPRDWTSAFALGDLYVEADQSAAGLSLFRQMADRAFSEGMLPRAAAAYRRVLKLQPDDESAQLQLAEVVSLQRLQAEARIHVGDALEQHPPERSPASPRAAVPDRAEGGVASTGGSADEIDCEAYVRAASAIAETGDTSGAAAPLRAIAADLVRGQREDDALRLLREAVRLDPDDTAGRTQLVLACLTATDIDGAHERLTDAATAAEPALRLALAELEFRAQRLDAGRRELERILALDADARDDILQLGWTLSAADPFASFTCVDVLVQAAIGRREWGTAAALLRHFLERSRAGVGPALQLVEVCLDGSLDDQMVDAWGRLADECESDGLALEARWLAEDLVALAPREGAHRERLRRAVATLGETVPEAGIGSGSRERGDDGSTASDALAMLATPSGRPAWCAWLSPMLPEEDRVRSEWAHVDRLPVPLDELRRREEVSREVALLPADWSSPEPVADQPPASGPLTSPHDIHAEPAVTDGSDGGVWDEHTDDRRELVESEDQIAGVTEVDDPALAEKDEAPATEPPPELVAPVDGPDAGAASMPEPADVATVVPSPPTSDRGPVVPRDVDLGDIRLDGVDLGEPPSPEAEPPVALTALESFDAASPVEQPAVVATPVPATLDTAASVAPRPDRDTAEGRKVAALVAPPLGGPMVAHVESVEPSPAEERGDASGHVRSALEAIRRAAAGLPGREEATHHYDLAIAYQERSMLEECIKELQAAACLPDQRFQATVLLGKLCRERGMVPEAVSWFQRAVLARAPTPRDGLALRYDLADALEAAGESTQALAVLRGLRSEAADFRDVEARVARLAVSEAGGLRSAH